MALDPSHSDLPPPGGTIPTGQPLNQLTPPASDRPGSSSPVSRSRNRQPEVQRPPPPGGRLWDPNDPVPNSPAPTESGARNKNGELIETMMKQPEMRPISQDQLVAEVKGIYAGLVMVEAKCIEVDNVQNTRQPTSLNDEQWQALVALHRTLLNEHHDFFLASQHAAASPALRRLATKYAMPARMWRHGIHSFLELLRHRLPGSIDHMLAFIYLAYAMMALLCDTVPAFRDTWIECLGDLGRYRHVNIYNPHSTVPVVRPSLLTVAWTEWQSKMKISVTGNIGPACLGTGTRKPLTGLQPPDAFIII